MKTKNVILAIMISLSAISAKAAATDIKQQRVQLVASFLKEKNQEYCKLLPDRFRWESHPTCLEYSKVEQRTITEILNKGPGYDILRSMLLDRGQKACNNQLSTRYSYASDTCWEMIQSKVAAFDALAAGNIQVVDILIENFNDKATAYKQANYSEAFADSQKSFVQLVIELAK